MSWCVYWEWSRLKRVYESRFDLNYSACVCNGVDDDDDDDGDGDGGGVVVVEFMYMQLQPASQPHTHTQFTPRE